MIPALIPRQIVIYASLGFAALFALLLAHDIRVNSLRAYYKDGWAKDRASWKVTSDAAIKQAERLTQASKDLANVSQQAYQSSLTESRSADDEYIDTHRVRPANAVCASPTPKADSPAVPAPVPTDVVMAEADVRACGDLYTYSVNSHNWAVQLPKGN